MISCLCVTRGDRPAMLAEAIADFVHQSFAERELLILHDGDECCQRAIRALAAPYSQATIRVERHGVAGDSLGALRNAAVAAAHGEWICQWDDDDRYHPQRLQLQYDAAMRGGAAVNFLVDQLHWFRDEGRLCWDDWDVEPYPMNLIQGTLMARREVLPPYLALRRGEDTAMTLALLRRDAEEGFGVSRLHGSGWCCVYSFHGGNVFDAEHHRAISALKHLQPARLLPRLAELRRRWLEYRPALPRVSVSMGRRVEWIGGG